MPLSLPVPDRACPAATSPAATDPPGISPRRISVDVVLPCLNEAAALPRVLSGLPPGWRAVVVDNGSTDGGADVARRLGAHVVTEPRRGFGSACAAGLRAATADVVAFCDADASLDLAELPRLVALVVTGARHRPGAPVLALGRRRPTRAGAWPVHARVANRWLARRVSRAAGARLHDLGPMRAAPRRPLLDLDLRDPRFGYPWRWSCARPPPVGSWPRRTSATTRGWAARRSPARCAARPRRSRTCAVC